MGDFNSQKNRVVWVDIPVANLERANAFYAAVMNITVHPQQFNDYHFSVLDHEDGSGGCLVPQASEVSTVGVLIYLNVDGRIRDAVAQVEAQGGKVLEPTRSMGPHGFRALVLDSEGNRVALHSNSDA